MNLLRNLHVLRWHGTRPVEAYPGGVFFVAKYCAGCSYAPEYASAGVCQ